MDKWRLRNKTTGLDEFVIASSEPTLCPSNPTDIIKPLSCVIVEEDIKVNDGTPKELTLEDYKQLRYNEIDGKTMAMTSAGFLHDGELFSLSIYAQLNWNALMDETSHFTFPKDVSKKNNSKHSLTEANVPVLWNDGKAYIESILDGGRDLKQLIFDAVDEDAVDLIVDTR